MKTLRLVSLLFVMMLLVPTFAQAAPPAQVPPTATRPIGIRPSATPTATQRSIGIAPTATRTAMPFPITNPRTPTATATERPIGVLPSPTPTATTSFTAPPGSGQASEVDVAYVSTFTAGTYAVAATSSGATYKLSSYKVESDSSLTFLADSALQVGGAV